MTTKSVTQKPQRISIGHFYKKYPDFEHFLTKNQRRSQSLYEKWKSVAQRIRKTFSPSPSLCKALAPHLETRKERGHAERHDSAPNAGAAGQREGGSVLKPLDRNQPATPMWPCATGWRKCDLSWISLNVLVTRKTGDQRKLPGWALVDLQLREGRSGTLPLVEACVRSGGFIDTARS